MNNEKTLVIIKPDSINKNIIGEILSHFEKNELKIVAAKMEKKNKFFFEEFYKEHQKKIFFQELINFMTSKQILALVIEGKEAVKRTRDIIGDTNYQNAKENTIRKKFASSLTKNVVHGSDSIISAKREIKLFFKDEEIF